MRNGGRVYGVCVECAGLGEGEQFRDGGRLSRTSQCNRRHGDCSSPDRRTRCIMVSRAVLWQVSEERSSETRAETPACLVAPLAPWTSRCRRRARRACRPEDDRQAAPARPARPEPIRDESGHRTWSTSTVARSRPTAARRGAAGDVVVERGAPGRQRRGLDRLVRQRHRCRGQCPHPGRPGRGPGRRHPHRGHRRARAAGSRSHADDRIYLRRGEVTSNGIEPAAGASVISLAAPQIVLNASTVTSLTGDGQPLAGSGEAQPAGRRHRDLGRQPGRRQLQRGDQRAADQSRLGPAAARQHASSMPAACCATAAPRPAAARAPASPAAAAAACRPRPTGRCPRRGRRGGGAPQRGRRLAHARQPRRLRHPRRRPRRPREGLGANLRLHSGQQVTAV